MYQAPNTGTDTEREGEKSKESYFALPQSNQHMIYDGITFAKMRHNCMDHSGTDQVSIGHHHSRTAVMFDIYAKMFFIDFNAEIIFETSNVMYLDASLN